MRLADTSKPTSRLRWPLTLRQLRFDNGNVKQLEVGQHERDQRPSKSEQLSNTWSFAILAQQLNLNELSTCSASRRLKVDPASSCLARPESFTVDDSFGVAARCVRWTSIKVNRARA